jgi:hypothetical protein
VPILHIQHVLVRKVGLFSRETHRQTSFNFTIVKYNISPNRASPFAGEGAITSIAPATPISSQVLDLLTEREPAGSQFSAHTAFIWRDPGITLVDAHLKLDQQGMDALRKTKAPVVPT